MESTLTAVRQDQSVPARGARWREIALGLSAILAAVVVLSVLPSRRVVNWFRVGPALLSVTDAEIGEGVHYGPLAVARGHFYQADLRVVGARPFVLHLDYQDGSDSKHYNPQLSFDATERMAFPIIRATHDDPAAALAIEPAPDTPSSPLHLQRLEIYEVRGIFYILRAVVRIGALLVIFAGLLAFGRRCFFRWTSSLESRVSAASMRRAAGWATALLVLMGGFGLLVVQDRHSRLFREPTSPSIYGWDGSFYYYWLRSAMVDGDVDFARDLRYCNSMPPTLREATLQDSPRTEKGLIPNKYPIGWALLEVPWYLAADGTARITDLAGGSVPRDGWQPLYQAFLVLGQVAYAVTGLWLAYRVLLEWLPPAFAAGGVALGWLCSPLPHYQTLNIAMAHNVMFFAVAGAYFSALALRRNPAQARWWALVGVCCALAILARYQGAVMLLFPGAVCLQEVWRAPRRWALLVLGIAASAVPLALQALAWKALYGSYLLYTYEGEGFDWSHPHLWEVLFSPFHGWFNWHPALLAGVLGFAGWAVVNRRRTEAVCFALSLGLMIYVNAAWQCWWFGDSFGSRAFEACTLFAMLGFGWTLRVLAPRPGWFHATAAALLLAGLWNMNLLWLSNDGPLSLARPITWAERAEMSRRFWVPR